MKTTLFKFYPPKKEKNPYLLPNSDLLPSSVLSPLSKNAKKRKFCGAKNKKAAFGPANAQGMASAPALAIIPGPTVGGYGVSSYGALAYGEAEAARKKEKALLESRRKKTQKSKKYVAYGNYENIFESI
jgi:hypothetical protein